MERFFLFFFSVYSNKSLKIQSITKQELPKHKVEQNPTYETHSLKKGFNKKLKLFAKADSEVDKIFSFPRVKLTT